MSDALAFVVGVRNYLRNTRGAVKFLAQTNEGEIRGTTANAVRQDCVIIRLRRAFVALSIGENPLAAQAGDAGSIVANFLAGRANAAGSIVADDLVGRADAAGSIVKNPLPGQAGAAGSIIGANPLRRSGRRRRFHHRRQLPRRSGRRRRFHCRPMTWLDGQTPQVPLSRIPCPDRQAPQVPLARIPCPDRQAPQVPLSARITLPGGTDAADPIFADDLVGKAGAASVVVGVDSLPVRAGAAGHGGGQDPLPGRAGAFGRSDGVDGRRNYPGFIVRVAVVDIGQRCRGNRPLRKIRADAVRADAEHFRAPERTRGAVA